MGLISITPIVDGNTASAADVNNPLNTIVAEINGNIDTVNLKDGAVTSAKIATGAALANLAAGSIATTYIADDAITDAKRPRLKYGSYARSSNQSIPDATATAIQFNSEVADPENWHDNSTNPSRITLTETGLYRVEVYTRLGVGTDTTQDAQLFIYVNGAEVRRDTKELNASFDDTNYVSYTAVLSATDYVEAYYYQNSGGAKNIGAGAVSLVVVKLSD